MRARAEVVCSATKNRKWLQKPKRTRFTKDCAQTVRCVRLSRRTNSQSLFLCDIFGAIYGGRRAQILTVQNVVAVKPGLAKLSGQEAPVDPPASGLLKDGEQTARHDSEEYGGRLRHLDASTNA
uniref:Uncharacterized protein n=1 Tax=Rhipicephalus zambeziensis TaxID=60191 RepID=A0A224Y6A3_9ACAR